MKLADAITSALSNGIIFVSFLATMKRMLVNISSGNKMDVVKILNRSICVAPVKARLNSSGFPERVKAIKEFVRPVPKLAPLYVQKRS